jgi:hypothetical protein
VAKSVVPGVKAALAGAAADKATAQVSEPALTASNNGSIAALIFTNDAVGIAVSD